MIKNLSGALALAALALMAAPAGAQTGGAVVGTAPGKAAAVQTVKITATIAAIGHRDTRCHPSRDPQGNLLTVTAGPDVKNFDKLKVGDQVDLQYVEALTLELKKGGGLIVRGRTDKADAVAAKKGEMPGAAAGRQVTIIADVVAVDAAKQIVTLKGPKQTVDLRIADPGAVQAYRQG